MDFIGLSSDDICVGGTCGGEYPPDPNGDVGPNHIIEAVNDAFAIYDKAGNILTTFTENNLFGLTPNPCANFTRGDPIVIYDPLGDRWILTNLGYPSLSGPFYECIAVSKKGDSDPNDAFVHAGWWIYAIRMDPGAPGAPTGYLNDYPKFGVWPDCLYMSSNEFDTFSQFAGVSFAAFSRKDLEAGNTLNGTMGFIPVNVQNIFTMIPSTMLGASPGSLPPPGTPNYFVSQSTGFFQFEVRTFSTSNNCSTGVFTTQPTVVSQETYNDTFVAQPYIVPQPSAPNNVLDSLGDRLMQKVPYRKIGSAESLWVNHSVMQATPSTPGATVMPQWAQIDVTGGTIAPSPVQQQIFNNAPDTTLFRWIGSLSVDKDGSMALGYSTSNGTAPNYPSIAYSGRLSTDPPNLLPQSETQLFAGTGSQTVNCGGSPCLRWGDYSSMSTDPSDDCTFWYINEYYDSSSGSNWHTRVSGFRFTTCDPNDLVRLASAPNTPGYPDIVSAFAAVTGNDALDIQQITFYKDLTLDNNFIVTFNGGYRYNSTTTLFEPFTGFSAVHGVVTIGGTGTGTIEFNGISIQ